LDIAGQALITNDVRMAANKLRVITADSLAKKPNTLSAIGPDRACFFRDVWVMVVNYL
jgi:hypothetical protein